LQFLWYSRWLLGCFDWLLVGVMLDWIFWFTRFGVLGVSLCTVSVNKTVALVYSHVKNIKNILF